MSEKSSKRNVTMGNQPNPNLPKELLEDILSRLPFKELVRFKCVCKSWYAIFDDPIFLSRHLSNFIENHNSADSVFLRLSFPTIFGGGMENYKLFLLSSGNAHYSAVEMPKPKVNMLSTEFQISGHCNGVLCLSINYWPGSKEVILYNPATRACRILPNSHLRLKSSFALAVGLGYDPQTDDYKVKRIWRKENIHGVLRTNYVEEYSLSASSWVELENTNAGNFHFGADCFAFYFKGTYYWWASERRDKSSIILALDMGEETFHKVPVPDYVDISNPHGRSLAIWNESVALIFCKHYDFLNQSIEICVMDGFGAEGSWTKTRSIMHLPQLPKPLLFWKGNELLLQKFNGKIISYNVDTQEINEVDIKGNPIQYSSQAVNYGASLV